MRLSKIQSMQDLKFRIYWEEQESHIRGSTISRAMNSLMLPDANRVWGIDTSHWNGNVAYEVTKQMGGSFVIIKCQDGTVETRYWKSNRARAITAGLIVGDYFWLYPNKYVSCKLQATVLWSRLKNLPKQLPVTVDFEWTKYNGQTANPTYSDLDLFVTEFISLAGYKPMLYSAAGYMNQYGRIPESLKKKFSAFWFANYGVSKPTLPLGFTDYDFWQFSASGNASILAPSDNGQKEVDLDYWNGTIQELRDFAGVTEEVPPPSNNKIKIPIVI